MSNKLSVSKYRAALLASIDARALYEANKDASNVNIQKTLSDIKSSVDHDAVVKFFALASVDHDLINRHERNNARFNVYAFQKIVNIARASAKAQALNHYTSAILRSAKACADASVSFSHADAVTCCSIDQKLDAAKAHLLTQYQKRVAATTCTTQASSSIEALQAFDVLRETRDTSARVCYVYNAESDVAKALLA